MSFSHLGLSDKGIAAIDSAGYKKPTAIQAQAIPHVLAKARRARYRSDWYRQDRLVRAAHADARERPRPRAHAPHAPAEPIREPPRRSSKISRSTARTTASTSRCSLAAFRLTTRMRSSQGRRRADRDTRPHARSLRARAPVAVRRRAAGDRRSRPHARHGLHPRHRAHLRPCPITRQTLFDRHDAAGNRAARRAFPARSGEIEVPAATCGRHHRRSGWSRRGQARREAVRCAADPAAVGFKNAIVFCNRKREVATAAPFAEAVRLPRRGFHGDWTRRVHRDARRFSGVAKLSC